MKPTALSIARAPARSGPSVSRGCAACRDRWGASRAAGGRRPWGPRAWRHRVGRRPVSPGRAYAGSVPAAPEALGDDHLARRRGSRPGPSRRRRTSGTRSPSRRPPRPRRPWPCAGVERSRPISPRPSPGPRRVRTVPSTETSRLARAHDHVLVAPLALGHHAGAGVVVDLVHARPRAAPARPAGAAGTAGPPQEHRGALAGHERRLVEPVGGGPRQDGGDRQDQARRRSAPARSRARSMSTDPRRPPRLSAIPTPTSNTENTAIRERFGMPRWRSVNPATSTSALPMPTTASAARATAGRGEDADDGDRRAPQDQGEHVDGREAAARAPARARRAPRRGRRARSRRPAGRRPPSPIPSTRGSGPRGRSSSIPRTPDLRPQRPGDHERLRAPASSRSPVADRDALAALGVRGPGGVGDADAHRGHARRSRRPPPRARPPARGRSGRSAMPATSGPRKVPVASPSALVTFADDQLVRRARDRRQDRHHRRPHQGGGAGPRARAPRTRGRARPRGSRTRRRSRRAQRTRLTQTSTRSGAGEPPGVR